MRRSNTIERLAFENKNSFYVTTAPPKKHLKIGVLLWWAEVDSATTALQRRGSAIRRRRLLSRLADMTDRRN